MPLSVNLIQFLISSGLLLQPEHNVSLFILCKAHIPKHGESAEEKILRIGQKPTDITLEE